jgi:radical SAM protein with 4Fe4S-binding SPASM domain
MMCDIPSSRCDDLSTDTLCSALEDAAALGAGTAVFSGGEPLLRRDIFELVSFCKKLGLGACVTSNGSLVDETVSGKLADAGVDVVNISVEGDLHTHERLRGAGTYEKALHALRCLRGRGVETTIASTVSRYNYSSLEHIVELARDTGATTLKFQPFSRIFVSPGRNCSEFLLGDVEAKTVMDILRRIHVLCGHYGVSVNPLPYLESIPAYLSSGIGGSAASCRALFSSCPVDASGKIFPCWVLSGKEMLIGDITRTPLKEIWGTEKHRDIIARINKRNCGGCLMSCYDANFSPSIFSPASGILQKTARSAPWSALRRIVKKIAFYLAYRGGALRLLRRLSPEKYRRGRGEEGNLSKEMEELKKAEAVIEGEIRHSR